MHLISVFFFGTLPQKCSTVNKHHIFHFLQKTAVSLLMNGEHGRHDLPQILFGHGMNAGADILIYILPVSVLKNFDVERQKVWKLYVAGQLGNTSAIKRFANLE